MFRPLHLVVPFGCGRLKWDTPASAFKGDAPKGDALESDTSAGARGIVQNNFLSGARRFAGQAVASFTAGGGGVVSSKDNMPGLPEPSGVNPSLRHASREVVAGAVVLL